jgi:uncharacterized protein YlxW (UPF0749 family)
MKFVLSMIFCTLTCSSLAFADDGFTPGEVKLNAQIQAQIKSLQDQQQQQLATLNSQLQAQIQKVHDDLEREIQTANSQTQDQLKQLQAQIAAKS